MSCTCLEFQHRKLPCRHVMAVFKEQTLDPEDYTSQLYSVNTYRNIYLEDYALDPIRIEDLKPSSRCRAPLIQKKSGRPQKKRLRKSLKQKKKQHCTICGSENHNRRQCDGNPEDHEASRNSSEENQSETTWNGFSDSNNISDSDEEGI